jgi:hypothetical protein
LETEVTVFKEVSEEKFDEIGKVIKRFIRSRDWKNTFRVRNLDEDEDLKKIIELFEENSAIKGSVGDATIYVIPVYYYKYSHLSGRDFGKALIASLVIERDSSGYTVRVDYRESEPFDVPSREEAEKRIDEEWIGGFIKLLKKALETKHPLTTKLAKLIDCGVETEVINFLYKLYGDEILNDDTIPGIYSVCSWETRFFANDKVIVIPSIVLRVVRDTRSNRVFRYDHDRMITGFYEVPPEKKIFFDTLFERFRDLLKPDVEIETDSGYRYVFSSSEVDTDGRKTSLVMIREYNPKYKEWRISGVFAVTCDKTTENKCSVYSFRFDEVTDNLTEMEKQAPTGLKEAFLGYFLGSEKIPKKAKGEMTKELIKEREWEILPA